jgi:diguanylate cyclase (GGDEF)-like protein
MTLRFRTLSIVALVLVALCAILYAASSAILMGGYARLEQKEAEREVRRAQHAIEASLAALALNARDWATWDDTYAFMADGNAHYRAATLIPASLANLDVDFLLLLRPDGSLYAGGRLEENTLVPLRPESVSEMVAGGTLLASNRPGGLTGVVAFHGEPLLVAAAPILTSGGAGPERGRLIMGRLLTRERLERVAESVRLRLELLPPGSGDASSATPLTVRVEGRDKLAGYGLLADPRGAPVAVLRVEQPRWIYAQGRSSQRYLLVNLVVVSLLFLLVVFVLLERMFLARIARLHDAMETIRRDGDPGERVPVEGTDELGRLAGTINETLHTLEQAQQRLHHDALHDPLTGLANRALFVERLAGAIETERRDSAAGFAVLLVDLDHFKLVNDSLGHTTGDRLLLTAARRMTNVLRESDMAARLGGDEFAVLLEPIVDAADASRCAERILQSLRSPMTWNERQLHLSASIGIALFEGAGETPEQLLRDADTAMYRAKQRGRDCAALFDQHMHEQVVARLELENELRQGIRAGQLRAWYQPIFDLETKRLRGFESLVRWHHPERGLLTPDHFVPMAEQAGLVSEIDRWMLAESCRCQARWQARFGAGFSTSVSVNLSCGQMHLMEITREVKSNLAATGLVGANIGLEITESALVDAEADLINQLFELKELGVRLYLDDFGTGYSSLSRLHRLPIDVLKIDRSFVARLDRGDSEIAGTIVTLAHSLGMEVVAEGIETPSQAERLREFGCEYGQGYLFSRPLNEEQATLFLERFAAPLNAA